jgi:hypothetical protein
VGLDVQPARVTPGERVSVVVFGKFRRAGLGHGVFGSEWLCGVRRISITPRAVWCVKKGEMALRPDARLRTNSSDF